jgi:hypothetical protein
MADIKCGKVKRRNEKQLKKLAKVPKFNEGKHV